MTLGVPDTDIRKCLLKNADDAKLRELTVQNLNALKHMVDYNLQNGVRLFRISSDIIPFASSSVNKVNWADDYALMLDALGQAIRSGGMRVSMHPGQYTVLNSPNVQTVENTVRELAYHTQFLDSLGVDDTCKIILHLGGAYGDKPTALKRFVEQYRALPDRVRARLVIENDDKIYTAHEALEVGLANGIPVVFDNLHHQANHTGDVGSERAWIAECAKTWKPADGRPKIHYSQSNPQKKLGAHSLSIGVDTFLSFYQNLPDPTPDVMLEVKDKNISAIKCILCTAQGGGIGALEREWGRYKYLVLERSQAHYARIRALLKDKAAYPAVAFYQLVEQALAEEITVGSAVNAAEHVWGYFKDCATPRQKAEWQRALQGYAAGAVNLSALKHRLYVLAVEYGQEYLLESYYFVKPYYETAVSGMDR